ncbi:MAG: phosphate signaling complex protein PhoU [Acidimicrobiia bacterium]|nr:phosphate signaling complex protein PhoU [Acidimicrobiia bacterium]NNC75154.1 phosphate signaling complex protein PhoU [Acidimicrobiia bacterium]
MTDTNEATNASDHEEIRHHFEDQLDAIRHGAVQMGSLVLENTKRVGDALVGSRLDMVEDVKRADDEINVMYTKLEGMAFEVLARQQPVAKDLRFLVAVTRILYELERSGDLAVNCAKAMDRAAGFTLSSSVTAQLERLVHESARVFAGGIDALADMDSTAGSRLDQEDDVVDDVCSEFYSMIARDSDAIGLAAAIELSRIGRYLERIADHAVNVAENVTYVVTGHWPHLENPDFEDRNE